MRLLLLLALLLYNILEVIYGGRPSFDYEEAEKRHSMYEERRNWRKNALNKEHKEWEEEAPSYRGQRHYDDLDKGNMLSSRSAEMSHTMDKESEKKPILSVACERPHERYEPCFAGCASISCDNPREHLRPCYPFCEPGCVCVPPYVRDDRTHKCVLPDDCTRGLKGIPDLGDDI